MCLQHATETYDYEDAFVVLAGPGWSHKDSYVEGGFDNWMDTPNVKVLDFDGFLEEFQVTLNC